MASSDTVVGIVGAVILTGAMIAVFYYENTNAEDGGGSGVIGEGSQTFTFTYVQSNATAVDGQSKTIEGTGDAATQEVTFDLPAYVYEVHATVTWSDDEGDIPEQLRTGEDQLKVELLNEADVVLDDVADRSGEILVHHGHGPEDANTTPPQQTVVVAGDSEEDARAALDEATADAHGTGTWTVKVTRLDAGTAPAGAEQRDPDQSFTVTVTYRYWEPQLQS